MIYMETNRLILRNVAAKDADIMHDYRNNEICAQYQRGQTKDHDGIVALLKKLGYKDMGYIPSMESQVFGKWTTTATEAEIAQATN